MAKSTVVGAPIEPGMLKTLGALKGFKPPDGEFDPTDYTNTWSVWVSHGYRESGNEVVGSLRIKRQGSMLTVDRKIVNDGPILHHLYAEVTIGADALSSPIEWTQTSAFTGADGKEIADLAASESARVVNGTLEVTSAGRVSKLAVPKQLTSDWSLFDAVQRLPRKIAGPGRAFGLLENLSLPLAEHRLSYRGRDASFRPDGKTGAHWFHQIGHGLLPYEYWLDDAGRLLIVATFARAYIFDPNAEDETEKRMAGKLAYAKRRAKGGK